jgi:phospholipid transport system substrate-binding protein
MTDTVLRAVPGGLGRRSALAALVALAVALGGLATSSGAAAAEGPTAFLERFSERARDRLTGDVSDAERRQRFEKMLEEGFALREVSQFILARYWRAASEEERDAFVDVFKDYLAQRFLPLFEDAGSFELRFGEPQQPVPDREDLFEVPVVFVSKGGERGPVNTLWRVRQEDGGYKILDVRAEGTSMAITLRDEYNSVIRRSGGSVAALIEELRKLIDTGQVSPAG